VPIVALTDVAISFETAGAGEAVLLVHGLGSSARDWERQVPVLARSYRVVTPDLRGHGRSGKPRGPYEISLFARDLAGLIRALAIAPVHLVGLSLGGFVAFQLALDYPHLVRSLVAVNSVPGFPNERLRDRLRLWSQLALRRLVARWFGMRTLGRLLGGRLFPRPDQSVLKRTFIERWAANDPKAYLASLAAVAGWDVRDRLGELRCPTCLITGAQDLIPLALKEACAATLQEREGAACELVVIPNSGHFTPVDAPAAFNEALLSFLARQRDAGGPQACPLPSHALRS